jgi:hypothetical protein
MLLRPRLLVSPQRLRLQLRRLLGKANPSRKAARDVVCSWRAIKEADVCDRVSARDAAAASRWKRPQLPFPDSVRRRGGVRSRRTDAGRRMPRDECVFKFEQLLRFLSLRVRCALLRLSSVEQGKDSSSRGSGRGQGSDEGQRRRAGRQAARWKGVVTRFVSPCTNLNARPFVLSCAYEQWRPSRPCRFLLCPLALPRRQPKEKRGRRENESSARKRSRTDDALRDNGLSCSSTPLADSRDDGDSGERNGVEAFTMGCKWLKTR